MGVLSAITRMFSSAKAEPTEVRVIEDWSGERSSPETVRQAVAQARGSRVELDDLPEEARQAVPLAMVQDGTVRPLKHVEKEYILAALELNDGNQTRTAKQLGIGSATLYRRLKSYGLANRRSGSEETT